jgi:CheY-like chemotaxis protein
LWGGAVSHVLVIDDQPSIRTVVETALEEDGAFQVTGAATGDDALASFEGDAPALIVLDLVMPGMQASRSRRMLARAASPSC